MIIITQVMIMLVILIMIMKQMIMKIMIIRRFPSARRSQGLTAAKALLAGQKPADARRLSLLLLSFLLLV